MDRYALKDASGDVSETKPEEMWQRIAGDLASNSMERDLFAELLEDWKFVPSGRILAGGRTMYNCFVLGLEEDSRGGIMSTVTELIEVAARGGGSGINWSVLRPRNSRIVGVNGKSSGAVAWMRGADALADAIRQGGSRTAALMFVLDVWHPDVIELTRSLSLFRRANFSINISREFMDAVKEGKEWDLCFPRTDDPQYARKWAGDISMWKAMGLPTLIHRTVKARDLWRAIAESAYSIGSPGLVFLDRCNYMSNTWYLDQLICCNPCGEQPLPKNGSCNLGAINLTEFYDLEGKCIRWRDLGQAVGAAVRLLDRVIDVSEDVTKAVGDYQRLTRRIGLGTMGLADVLIMSKLRYGSDEANDFTRELFSFIRDTAYIASTSLAAEKGPAPGYDEKYYMKGKFIKTLPENVQDMIRQNGIRNMAILSQAPTGTTCILAGASSGIEPLYSKDFVREDATGTSRMTHPLFAGEPADYLVTAADVSVEDHIKVQALVQECMDSAISKTINLPNKATPADIINAYEQAFHSGCKGITVYRSGSLDDVLKPYCESCNS